MGGDPSSSSEFIMFSLLQVKSSARGAIIINLPEMPLNSLAVTEWASKLFLLAETSFSDGLSALDYVASLLLGILYALPLLFRPSPG